VVVLVMGIGRQNAVMLGIARSKNDGGPNGSKAVAMVATAS